MAQTDMARLAVCLRLSRIGGSMDTSFITINTHSSIRLEAKQGTVIYVDPYGVWVQDGAP